MSARQQPTGHVPAPKTLLGFAVATSCVLAGCHANAPTGSTDGGTVSTRVAANGLVSESGNSLINEGGAVFDKPTTNGGSLINEGGAVFGKPVTNGGTLINEGGPVFAQPDQFQLQGLVVTPRYFTGAPSDTTITAERLNGVAFPDVKASAVQPDWSFNVQGPASDKLFFVSATFNFEDTSHTVRALAKAGDSSKLTLDPTSTLLAAKISLAQEKADLHTLDYQDTKDLATVLRSHVGNTLANVHLDAPYRDLSAALDLAVAGNSDLAGSLRRWEFTIDPTTGATPVNMPVTTTPTTPSTPQTGTVPQTPPESGGPPTK